MTKLLLTVRRVGPIWIILALLVTPLASSCQRTASEPVGSIRIGTTTSEVNALVLIAQERGYFADNGLQVIRTIFPSGVAALKGLLDRQIDLATGSEFALVSRVLSGHDIGTIGAISRSSTEHLVGRVDRGISSISDLRGKTIGVPLGSRPEFSLDRFLYLQGIDPAQVSLVNVPVNQSVEALVNGTVDAVTSWQPYVDRMREQMGDLVVVWSTQEDQPSYTLLMSTAEWNNENKDLIARFLRSLVEAEGWVAAHPDEARALLREKLGYSEEYMADVWPNHYFSVLLDQALVAAMEDQARWMIDNKLTTATETPNLVSHIYLDGLETVKPEAVNIIR